MIITEGYCVGFFFCRIHGVMSKYDMSTKYTNSFEACFIK